MPGRAERWGRSAFHCPFCHGWEHRERPLGVLDPGPSAVTRALGLRAWSDDVTLYADGADLAEEDRERLAQGGVALEERPVVGLRGPAPELEAIALGDGTQRACGGVLVGSVLHQRSPLAEQLGAARAAPSAVFADAIEVDPGGRTSVPGLSAAGDAAGVMPSVANAIAAGANAAAMLVHDLMDERAPAEPVVAVVGAARR